MIVKSAITPDSTNALPSQILAEVGHHHDDETWQGTNMRQPFCSSTFLLPVYAELQLQLQH